MENNLRPAQVPALRVQQLRSELDKRGLSSEGLKEVLVARLRDALRGPPAVPQALEVAVQVADGQGVAAAVIAVAPQVGPNAVVAPIAIDEDGAMHLFDADDEEQAMAAAIEEDDHAAAAQLRANVDEATSMSLALAGMTTAARDGFAGMQLRKTDKAMYDRLVRNAVLEMEDGQRKKAMDRPDVHQPDHARSWIWDHAYLMRSRPKHIFCKICCPLSGGVPVPETQWVAGGQCSYLHASTSNIIAHLAKHFITPVSLPGAKTVPYETGIQQKISRLLVQGFQICDLRTDSCFEMAGAKEVLRMLLPRVRPPCHQTVARIRKGLRAEHDVAAKQLIQEAVAGNARCRCQQIK
jgi:hypothetical protein